MGDVFAGLLHPPVVRPGDVVKDPAAIERGRRGAAAKCGRRWQLQQNPWDLGGAEFACLHAIVQFDGSHEVIAEKLGISPKTLSSHLAHVREKMNVQTSVHAALKLDRWMLRGSKPEAVEVVLRYVDGKATVHMQEPAGAAH